MQITYGIFKAKVASQPALQSSPHGNATQYHLHTALDGSNGAGSDLWDSAVNVGTDDESDLLQYRLVSAYGHPIVQQLRALPPGFTELTGTDALPALDFLRCDVLTNTGSWQLSDVMDGSDTVEPAASLRQLLERAGTQNADVYAFGRTYTQNGAGIHDVHLNQGSTGSELSSNRIWQDGAVIVDFAGSGVSAYFTAFTQQLVPTDARGNPTTPSHPITDADGGSLVPQRVP